MRRAARCFLVCSVICALWVLVSICVGLFLYSGPGWETELRVCEWMTFLAALLGLALYAIGEVIA